jgi:hypothetical protein
MNRVIRIFLGHNQSFYSSALYQNFAPWQTMEFSEYENIEIFNKTQRFGINKCENQILTEYDALADTKLLTINLA